MPTRWCVIFAIEKYLEPVWGLVPYAESGVKTVAELLTRVGYPPENQVHLLGSRATRAIVEARLRTLKKRIQPGDQVLIYFAGRGFSVRGENYFACWDTLPDEWKQTAIALEDVCKIILGSSAAELVVLLDAGTGTPIAKAIQPHFQSAQLETLFRESERASCLTACHPEEVSQYSQELKASLWCHLLQDALSGRARKFPDGRLTTHSLQHYFEQELPRLLRQHCEAGTTQTPVLFGTDQSVFEIADLNHLSRMRCASSTITPEQLQRIVFRSESISRVKDLLDWRKTYEVPDKARSGAQKFIARVAKADIQADLELLFESTREQLGCKRKDLAVSISPEGVGVLRTPEFEYSITTLLDPQDSSRILWRREVAQFTNPGFLQSSQFATIFGKLIDQLVVDFETILDVEALVDRLEEQPLKGTHVKISSDGASCVITLEGYNGQIWIEPMSLRIRGRTGDTSGLLEQFLAFLQMVGPLGERKMLK